MVLRPFAAYWSCASPSTSGSTLPSLFILRSMGLKFYYNFKTDVNNFTVAFTEWLRIRHLYILASTKRRLYEPDTSTSRLLLLRPEIRHQICEVLVSRAKCARGRIRVTIRTRRHRAWNWSTSFEDDLRLPLHLASQYNTRTCPSIPTVFGLPYKTGGMLEHTKLWRLRL